MEQIEKQTVLSYGISRILMSRFDDCIRECISQSDPGKSLWNAKTSTKRPKFHVPQKMR